MANIIRRSEGGIVPGVGFDPFEVMREMLQWDPFRQLGMGHAQPQMMFAPQFEVRETPERYVFKADLPGVAEKDLEISLAQNRLTVSGHREAEKRDEGDRFYAYERTYGSFTRTFTLPADIDDQRVSADLREGVLTIEVPKAPESQPRKIAVKPGGGATAAPKGAKADGAR